MERLTKRDIEDGTEVVDISDSLFKRLKSHKMSAIEIDSKILHKLADYEDLEEQGRLLKLPCRDGDIIYSVVEDGLTIVELRFSLGFYARRGNDIGKTVFLAKSEAEAKLKELRGNQNEAES